MTRYRRRVATLIMCLQALLVVLPRCWGGKRQEHQCGEDSFHALIERLAGGSVNDEVGGQILNFRIRSISLLFFLDEPG